MRLWEGKGGKREAVYEINNLTFVCGLCIFFFVKEIRGGGEGGGGEGGIFFVNDIQYFVMIVFVPRLRTPAGEMTLTTILWKPTDAAR